MTHVEKRTDPLVDVAGLAAMLAADHPPVVLDVRWSLAGPDPAAFAEAHVPGAVFVDLDRELAAQPGEGGRHPLPAPEVVQELLRRAGIHDDSTVVVCGQRDVSIAGRLWWLLRWAGLVDVRVLDGGIDVWRSAGLPVATDPAAAVPSPGPGGGTATVRPGGMPTVDADGAAALGSEYDAALLDARAPQRYRGDAEPVDPVAGHIPGAANVPLAEIHHPDGLLRSRDELRQVFAAAGVRDGEPVAASCGSGVTACALILAGAVAGFEFSLYPGSYSGWCALGRGVATGEGR